MSDQPIAENQDLHDALQIALIDAEEQATIYAGEWEESGNPPTEEDVCRLAGHVLAGVVKIVGEFEDQWGAKDALGMLKASLIYAHRYLAPWSDEMPPAYVEIHEQNR